MAQIIGVRFKNAGKVYYFDPGRETFETGRESLSRRQRA